jgi:hypothetical protein
MPPLVTLLLLFLASRYTRRLFKAWLMMEANWNPKSEDLLNDAEKRDVFKRARFKVHMKLYRRHWFYYLADDACFFALAALTVAYWAAAVDVVAPRLEDPTPPPTPQCDVATRGVTACVLGVALASCLDASDGPRYCHASATDEWLEPLTTPLRLELAPPPARRHHLMNERGERYATQYALKVGADGLLAPRLVLVREAQLQTQLLRLGIQCPCAPQLGLLDNCSFVAHAERWMLLYDAMATPHYAEFSEDTTRLDDAARAQLTEYNNRLGEAGHTTFILRQSDTARAVQRVRLPLKGDAAACFAHCLT